MNRSKKADKVTTAPAPSEAPLMAHKMRGLYRAVAQELNLSHTHVRLVAIGQRQSRGRRVEKALARELKRRGIIAA